MSQLPCTRGDRLQLRKTVMAWTDERIDLLKNLWEKGLTASQIAEENDIVFTMLFNTETSEEVKLIIIN